MADDKTTLSAKLGPALIEWVDAQAAKERRTRADWLRGVLLDMKAAEARREGGA